MTDKYKTQRELEQWISIWEKANGCKVVSIKYNGQDEEPEVDVVITQLAERCAVCGNELLPLRSLMNGGTCPSERATLCCTNSVCARYRVEIVSMLRMERSRALVNPVWSSKTKV